MGRALRVQASEVIYHVTARGVRRLRVYEDVFDYRKFEALLERLAGEHGWLVHAYCQMPNHYHLLVETPKADISAGMCWLNGIYARWFNARHGYSGHLFEARFHTELVLTNAPLLSLASYIPLNPVRAGLCRGPGDWPWSSYRATVGRAARAWMEPSWLLAQFGRDDSAADAYERYVNAQMAA
jgi:REP element-mobilizing transposase RayT